jgi:hypothetical protein
MVHSCHRPPKKRHKKHNVTIRHPPVGQHPPSKLPPHVILPTEALRKRKNFDGTVGIADPQHQLLPA